MTRTAQIIQAVVSLAALALPATGQVLKTIHGRVVGPNGEPVANAHVDILWILRPNEAGEITWRSSVNSAVSDAEGNFSLACHPQRAPVPLIAMDEDQRLGAAITLSSADFNKPVTMRVQPLVTVHGKVDASSVKSHRIGTTSAPVNSPTVNLFLLTPRPCFLASMRANLPSFNLPLPPGEYRVVAHHGPMLIPVVRVVKLAPGQRTVDLGTLALKPEGLAPYVGKVPPPWRLTDTHGVARDVKLSDFRGKWVVVEFWILGCGPCVAGSLPNLVRLDEKYNAHRDKFAILTFHGPPVGTLAQLDPGMKRIAEKHWDGNELPLPILLDGTGQTIKDWGIHKYPTTILIDPDGKFVTYADPLTLRQHFATTFQVTERERD